MNTSQNDSKRTHFYVFVDKGSNQYMPNGVANDAILEVAPDLAVRLAFERLSNQYGNAVVSINPSDDLRKALGIESLPAFVISDSELPADGSLSAKPPKLPSQWNPIKLFERRRILASGKYLPKVERTIISLFKTPDSLYQFIRDLHLKQIDHGLVGAGQQVESEIRKIGGRKILSAVSITKKVFLPLI
jgi:hypothetical protein